MARFNFEESEKYQGESKFIPNFSLKNNGDEAKVRFLYNTIDDIEGYSVYEVGTGRRYKSGDEIKEFVNAIRAYNDPIDVDPMAVAGYRAIPKMFIPIYNITTGRVEVWQRGKNYFGQLVELAQKSGVTPFYNQVFSITRHGAAGDTSTTYSFYPDGQPTQFDISTIEVPQIVGKVIHDWSADDMKYFLNTGDFPQDSNKVAEQRSGAQQNNNYGDMPVGRRTPQF